MKNWVERRVFSKEKLFLISNWASLKNRFCQFNAPHYEIVEKYRFIHFNSYITMNVEVGF